MRTLDINDETTMFSSAVPIPTIGVLPVNAYLINGAEPTLSTPGSRPRRRSSRPRSVRSSTRRRCGGSS